MDNTIAKATLDVTSGLIVVGTLLDYLPKIAAGFAIAWYIYSFYKAFKK